MIRIRVMIFEKFLTYIIPFCVGIVILIFSSLGYSKAKQNNKQSRNIKGIILGLFMVIVSLLLTLWIE